MKDWKSEEREKEQSMKTRNHWNISSLLHHHHHHHSSFILHPFSSSNPHSFPCILSLLTLYTPNHPHPAHPPNEMTVSASNQPPPPIYEQESLCADVVRNQISAVKRAPLRAWQKRASAGNLADLQANNDGGTRSERRPDQRLPFVRRRAPPVVKKKKTTRKKRNAMELQPV